MKTLTNLIKKPAQNQNREKGFIMTKLAIPIAIACLSYVCLSYLSFLGMKGYIDDYIEDSIDHSNNSTVQFANVTGGPEAEKFIDYKGERFYSQIDGKPVNSQKGDNN